MALRTTLFANLASPVCPRCEQLTSILQEEHRLRLQVRVVSKLPLPCDGQPTLVFIRPTDSENCSTLLNGINLTWPDCLVFGLLCRAACTDSLEKWLRSLTHIDDFVCCPFEKNDLVLRIDRILARVDSRGGGSLKQDRSPAGTRLIGKSEVFKKVATKVPLFASSDATVLITGETGTGKELFAREIHDHSCRQDNLFVPVNCGAIPDGLFENELFGHTKGSYTGASTPEAGLVSAADHGTLFLDEVDSLSLGAQVKLLRFLQTGEYRSLGSPQLKAADVRIIAATNSNLLDRCRNGLFREDLFHRLNVLRLHVPALKQRIADVPLLVSHLMSKYDKQSPKSVRISWDAMQMLMRYSWPGNVRELEGVIQRALVLHHSGVIQRDDLELPHTPSVGGKTPRESFRFAKLQAISEFERGYLSAVLSVHAGNLSKSAAALDTDRRTLQRLVRKHQLDLSELRKC